MTTAVVSFCCLSLLLVAGKFLRMKIPLLQRLYLPSSIIGGTLGLILINTCGNYIPKACYAGWAEMPAFLINIVFAGLFLGMKVPPFKRIWTTAAPQLCYGQIVAWGQYVVGITMVLVLLAPLFGVPHQFGVVIPVGFEGGHGTASGLAPTFDSLGWSDGKDLGLASATVGMVAAIIIGMGLVNWAVNRGYVSQVKRFDDKEDHERKGVYHAAKQPPAGHQTVFSDSIDSLAFHIAIIGIAVLFGFLMKTGFAWLNGELPKSLAELEILKSFPLFPLCMIGGLILQFFMTKVKVSHLVNHQQMQRITGCSLDFLVVAAIATIRLEKIYENLAPFAILVGCGILWNIFCLIWLAPRLLPDYWFERAIAQLGQSMGVTATGLTLLRTVDPHSQTTAPASFGYKQLLHEPFMGGGLWTSLAIPLVIKTGGYMVLIISAGAILAWLLFWKLFLCNGRKFFKRPDFLK